MTDDTAASGDRLDPLIQKMRAMPDVPLACLSGKLRRLHAERREAERGRQSSAPQEFLRDAASAARMILAARRRNSWPAAA